MVDLMAILMVTFVHGEAYAITFVSGTDRLIGSYSDVRFASRQDRD